MNQKEDLYIPRGLKLRREIYNGFGNEELIKTIVISILASVFSLVFYAMTANAVISVLIVLVVASSSVMLLTKDNNNISAIDQIKYLMRFYFTQSSYIYVYQKNSTVKGDR